VSNLLIGLVSALLVTNLTAAVTNFVGNPTRVAVKATDTNNPAETEFQKLMDADDAAQAEVDQWIRDNQAFAAKGAGESDAGLNKRILARFAAVRAAYDDFLARHPDQARAHLAYAGFLQDIHDEDAALPHMEKSRELDPKNPATWNNLANYYGHCGEVKKAFEYYAKAIELNPAESVYFHNFGTTVYLFRKDAKEFYNLNEQQVFDKALDLYAKAMKLSPRDFPLATDVAQTYYGIKPLRVEEALKSWTNALAVAHDETEREGVHLHFARVNWLAGRTNEAHAHLLTVTNAMYAELKQRIARNLDAIAHESKATNAPRATPDKSTGQ
jgi:tetratricopeptide (TPR) repeat protein